MRPAMLLLTLAAVPVAAAPPETLTWAFDGHHRLPDAAAAAKRKGKRLLVGLAGSPT